MTKTEDEYTLRLKIKGLEHVWVNPKVYNAIRVEAKQEVFDDIENKVGIVIVKKLKESLQYQKLKQRHLSTFPKEKEHNSSSKKDCLHKDCQYYDKQSFKCDAPQKIKDKYKCSPS